MKVHKLNEMGEIVDKKGHRAWDMACALQLGIRVNVCLLSDRDGGCGMMILGGKSFVTSSSLNFFSFCRS